MTPSGCLEGAFGLALGLALGVMGVVLLLALTRLVRARACPTARSTSARRA